MTVLEAWRKDGRPTAVWSAQCADSVEGVRLGADEIAPDAVEILRTFAPKRPSPYGRLRLLRARESSKRVIGRAEFQLLGGEPGLAGETGEVSIDIGEGCVQKMGVLHVSTALSVIVPVEAGLETMTDEALTDLYLAMMSDLREAREAARRNVKPLFHQEDDLLGITVLERPGGGELRLAFGLEVLSDAAGFIFEAERVPPTLRHLLAGRQVFEPDVPCADAAGLLALARALASGRLRTAAALGWEGALAPHSPRRLFVIETDAGTLAFAVRLDDVAKQPLMEILEAIKKRGTR